MSKIPFELQPFDVSNLDVPNIAISGDLSLSENEIQINYQLSGNIGELQFPKNSVKASRKDKLWESTCFEVFIAKPGKSDYWEYNLSPSKDWAVFRFTDYRENKTDDLTISSINIVTRFNNTSQFKLNSSLPLPDNLVGNELCIGISAVIQDNSGNIYYYALSHRNQQPDFHDRDSFSIAIES